MKKILTVLSLVVLLCGCGSERRDVVIVPHPNSMTVGSGTCAVAGVTIHVDERADERTLAAVCAFAERLSAVSGKGNPVIVDDVSDEGIRFRVDDTLAEEAYALEVTRRGVEVRAASFPGFFYALQSIKQMLPVEIFGGEPAPAADWTLPVVRIDDAPRFGYRGMHFDVSRHFFSVEEVKRYIDILALHKLNVLHWHLTDDQGWRIEIKRYPRLAEVGSVRKGTMIGKQWGSSDGVPYGGFYTQDEIREIVAYAAAQAITVIPEIDLPGHMLAALTAYPELGCTGGPYDVWGRWGVAEDVLCPGREQTFEFIEGVLEEVMELFPSEYIHIGGDECPKVRWEKCPRCQARIRALGLKGDDRQNAEHYLQSYVITRVEKFLNDHGRRIIGWDEILEGELAPNATVMSWRGSEGGIAAAKMGHDVIMTPNTHFYFDHAQSLDLASEPLSIGGYLPIEKVYSFDPMAGLEEEQQKHILGVQANLWTEYIASDEHLEYMLLPRLSALSEVQWCQPGVRDWDRFRDEFRMDRIFDEMGYNYATHIFGVMGDCAVDSERGCIVVTLKGQGTTPIRYTTDGSDPTPSSPLYTAPIEIRSSCTLKAAADREGVDTPVYSRTFTFSKSTARPIVLNSQPSAKHTYGGAPLFVDGFCGNANFSIGAWVGFIGEPMDVTIDMKGAGAYSSVDVVALVQKSDWIFSPAAVRVSVSDDNEQFTEIGSLEIAEDRASDADGIVEYKVTFPETSARYLRVVAPTRTIPSWHGGAGRPGFAFVGEIRVD